MGLCLWYLRWLEIFCSLLRKDLQEGRTASSLPGHFHWSSQTVFILKSQHSREIFKKHVPNRFHHITFLCLFYLCRGKSQQFFHKSCLCEERKQGCFIRAALLWSAMCTAHASGHSILVFSSWGYFKISSATYIRDKSGIRISQPIAGWAIENYHLHFLPKFVKFQISFTPPSLEVRCPATWIIREATVN